jgi:glutaminyl-tRNA synthetase
LVFDNHVNGWDDPRLPTVNGLRRRGYTATAINRFCDLMSVSRRGNENFVNISNLENCLKKELDITARRSMGVIEPVKVEISNLEKEIEIEAPLFPKRPEKGTYKVHLTSTVYVDKADIKTDNEGKFGIFTDRIIGLKYAGPILIKSIERDSDNNPVLIKAEYLKEPK